MVSSSSCGSACSRSGKAYEVLVANVCARLKSPFMNKPLNTQSPKDLGGCSIKQDITLNRKRVGDINVEVKSKNVPDWIQCSITPVVLNSRTQTRVRWVAKQKSYQPHQVIAMFEDTINSVRVFEGNVPSFLTNKRSTTHDEWKQECQKFKDAYYPIDSSSIAEAYRLRGVSYIQVRGHGLFHTGTDRCGFGVPLFDCSQRLRIRCKRHGRKCSLTGLNIPSSVMASFRPILSTLSKSPFSLDDIKRVPSNLSPWDGIKFDFTK